MTDIRCPMCGKINPEELEKCLFCEARLKPLFVAPVEDESPSQFDRPSELDEDPKVEKGIADWLQSFRESESGEEVHDLEENADWLRDLRQESIVDEVLDNDHPSEMIFEETSFRLKDVEEDSSAWLKEMRNGLTPFEVERSRDSEEEPEVFPTPEESLPEEVLFTRMDPSFESREQKPETTPDIISEEEQIPDWVLDGKTVPLDSIDLPMTEIQPSTEGEVEKPFVEEETGFDDHGELPGWLADIESESLRKDEESDIPSRMVEDETPQEGEPTSILYPHQEKSPEQIENELAEVEKILRGDLDWLEELEIPSELDEPEQTEDTEPESLVNVEPFFVNEKESEVIQPAESEDFPGWLSDIEARETIQELEEPTIEDENIVLADLPEWLEAMRPVETLEVTSEMMDEEASIIETIGPLSGLMGVLPAEPDISYQKRPPAYSVKLQVSTEQQSDVDLLKELIDTETDLQPIPGRPVITSQHILRIIIAAVLFLAILPPLLPGGLQITPNALLPHETSAASRIVLGLDSQMPVLFAVDYQPGLSGEMDAAAAAVMDHLMLQGKFIILISTLPTGPIQAERLIEIVDRLSDHNYRNFIEDSQYINLGFIPGGQTGLLSFAENPQSMFSHILSDQGENSGDDLPIQHINHLADFSLVVVATEDANVARAWIEQVQPRLGETSLIMVTSAQIEPVVQPYFHTYPKQVHGIVSGLAGGTAYERSIGRSGNASSYWTSFSLGMIAVAFLVLIGGGINALTALLAQSKKNQTSGGIL